MVILKILKIWNYENLNFENLVILKKIENKYFEKMVILKILKIEILEIWNFENL